jgi:hypothetical protein
MVMLGQNEVTEFLAAGGQRLQLLLMLLNILVVREVLGLLASPVVMRLWSVMLANVLTLLRCLAALVPAPTRWSTVCRLTQRLLVPQ